MPGVCLPGVDNGDALLCFCIRCGDPGPDLISSRIGGGEIHFHHGCTERSCGHNIKICFCLSVLSLQYLSERPSLSLLDSLLQEVVETLPLVIGFQR